MNWNAFKDRARLAGREVKKGIRIADKHLRGPIRTISDGLEVAAMFESVNPLSVAAATSRALATASDYARQSDGPALAIRGYRVLPHILGRYEVPALDELCDRKDKGENGITKWIFVDIGLIITQETDEPAFAFTLDRIDDSILGMASDTQLHDFRGRIHKWILKNTSSCLEIAINDEDQEKSVFEELEMKSMSSPRADEILDSRIRPMLDEPSYKCVLIYGPPGTGKTVASHYLAENLGPGDRPTRIISFRFDLADMSPIDITGICKVWKPDVILIDDIDKLEDDLPNSNLEACRDGAGSLVIITANNAMHQGVLDGSLMRNGRVDESFELLDIGIHIDAPEWMGSLSDELREELSEWPIAALEALEARYRCRGADGLEIDEMRCRHDLQTISGGRIWRGDDEDEDE